MTHFEKLVAEAKKNITEISPVEAAEKARKGDAVIVDVRDRDEWEQGHIPDAIHLSRGEGSQHKCADHHALRRRRPIGARSGEFAEDGL
jgi:rhodanese-related sulfurtransferase